MQRRGKPGDYSFHSHFKLSTHLGGGELSVQFINTREKDGGNYRAEHLRAIPYDDEYHDIIYRRRNWSESHNAALQRTLPWGRAHSYGSASQLTEMMAFAVGQKCHGARGPPAPEAVGAGRVARPPTGRPPAVQQA